MWGAFGVTKSQGEVRQPPGGIPRRLSHPDTSNALAFLTHGAQRDLSKRHLLQETNPHSQTSFAKEIKRTYQIFAHFCEIFVRYFDYRIMQSFFPRVVSVPTCVCVSLCVWCGVCIWCVCERERERVREKVR